LRCGGARSLWLITIPVSTSQDLKFPNFSAIFKLFEVELQKLPERVQAAEATIFLRQQVLVQSSDGKLRGKPSSNADLTDCADGKTEPFQLEQKVRRRSTRRIKVSQHGSERLPCGRSACCLWMTML
jgi:hypothetical protein